MEEAMNRRGEFCVHEYFTREGEVGVQYEIEREGRMEYLQRLHAPGRHGRRHEHLRFLTLIRGDGYPISSVSAS